MRKSLVQDVERGVSHHCLLGVDGESSYLLRPVFICTRSSWTEDIQMETPQMVKVKLINIRNIKQNITVKDMTHCILQQIIKLNPWQNHHCLNMLPFQLIFIAFESGASISVISRA